MPAAALVELAEWEVFVRRGREVMDVDGLPVHERPPSHRVTVVGMPSSGHQRAIVPYEATTFRTSPSTRARDTSFASQRRVAFSDTASRKGWMSVGELLITRRISAVAVCCSSASV